MSDFFGPEIGRHYSSEDRQFSDVLYLPDGPIVAEEFVLGSSVQEETRQKILQNNVPSGWITNPNDPKSDFKVHQKASNMFWLGKDGSEEGDILYAMINGWIIPVAGTNNDSDLRNVIQLPPPQSTTSSSDVNFVFLEAWKARLSPGNSVNKPADNKIYKYGNVLYGGNNLDEEMLDPRFEKESAERTQIQYRIRVVNQVDPTQNPYGFNSSIKAQGPLDSPVSNSNSNYNFQNMESELNDPGLWRAGEPHQLNAEKSGVLSESDLKTIDGFVYAVPLCFVFRRSDEAWTVTSQAGAHNRNPNMSQASEAEVLPKVQLDGKLSRDETNSFTVDTSQSSTKFDSSGGFVKVEDEIIEYSSYSGTTVDIATRGAKDTFVSEHSDGTQVNHVSGHPKGYFSDQIAKEDIYDLRHATSFGDWDFDSLLEKNFQKLIKGQLQSQWKISTGDVKGLEHWQVDHLSQSNPSSGVANHVEDGDGPDGFRKVFSDAATPQKDNLLVLNQDGSDAGTGEYSLNPTAEVFKFDSSGNWRKGDSIRIPLSQFKNTFNTSENDKVRFIHPDEYIDTDYDVMELWFGSTYKDNSVSGLQSPVNSEGSNPHFLLFGKKPDDLSPGTITGTGDDVDYDATLSPSEIDVQGVDFSQQPSSLGGSITIGDYLANQNAWIILQNASTVSRNGAFQILGDSGNGLEVEDIDGSDPSFGQGTESGMDWYIREEKCTETDDELLIALGNGLSGQPSDEFDDTNLFLSYDLLYHPARGLSRCPDEMYEIRLDTGNTSYLRTNTFENVQSSSTRESKKFHPVSMETLPYDRSGNPNGNPRDPQSSIENVWSEAYVDRGSKTLVFQPIRTVDVEVQSQDLNTSVSYGSIANQVGFEADDSSDPIVNVPGEALPKSGRIDLPFVTNQTNPPEPAWGLNSTLLQDSNTDNDDWTITNYLSIYDSDSLSSSDYNTVVNLSNVGTGGPNRDALASRIYDEGGTRGIELPPHFGVARLYGVYERSDFYNNEINGRGEFLPGNSNLYRQKDSSFNGTNLLRTDGERRSLFITEDDSFVIPEDVIDTSGLSQSFENASFIIEAAIFSFRNWSEDLVQIHPTTSSLSGEQTLTMLTNAPADSGATMEAISTRIPYQGNPAGTMPASTTNTSNVSYNDYRPKRESEDSSELSQLNSDLDIDDARVENPARAEILSMMPFATSLGTGRVSGEVHHGAYTDVGYLNQSGYPDSSSIGNQRNAESRGLVNLSEIDEVERTVSDRMTGLTERLPCGLYASDHQFLGEGFYGDQKKFWKEVTVDYEGHSTYEDDKRQKDEPPEEALVVSDGTSGGPSSQITYSNTNNLYRTYRGGTAMNKDGGPILLTGERVYKEYPFLRDFTTEYLEALENNSFSPSNVDKERIIEKHEKRLQIHGAVMFGIAFLIRTRKEEMTDNDIVTSHGNELQMAIMTGSVFGQEISLDFLSEDQSGEFLDPFIQLHPAGSGEGYCAADRFRLPARPLRSPSREPNEDHEVEVFRFRD